MANIPYYRNSFVNIGGVSIGELTRSLDDSAAFFDGPASDSSKQSILEKLIEAAKVTIIPLRQMGYPVDVVRSYSEGAVNHGTGYTLDISPASKNFEDCFGLAKELEVMKTCDQIWIEASDDEGNFHVHARANPNGFNPNPDLKTIYDVEGSQVTNGLNYAITKIENLTQVRG